MIIKSPRSRIMLEIIEDAQRDGVLDQEKARVMRRAVAPRCTQHGEPTVVLRRNKPCCARCWVERS